MGGDATDDILVRNIQRETLKACRDRQTLRVLPSEKFVSFIVKLHLLNPAWEITENFMACRKNVQQLVKHLINLLESQRHPVFVALKLQYFYQCCMEHLERSILAEKEQRTYLLSPLKAAILKTNIRSALMDPELLKKRIISYALLLIGQGNPQKPQVYNEAFYALKSVMNQKEMFEFVQEEEEEIKEQRLKELVYIISGIRIFNKYSGKSVGWDIKNIQGVLSNLITVMKGNMLDILEDTNMSNDIMRTVIDKVYIMDNNKNDIRMKLVLPTDMSGKDIEKIKDVLGIFTLYNIYVNDMVNKLDEVYGNVKQIYADLLKKVEEMCELVSQKVSTAAEVIFPEFIALCSKWIDLEDTLLPVSKIYAIWSKLNAIKREAPFNIKILDFIDEAEVVEGSADLKNDSDCDLRYFNPHVNILSEPDCESFDSQEIEYQGYCPFKLIETRGGLFHGNANKHLATFEGRTYVFTSNLAKVAFSQKPKKYVNGVLMLCIDKPLYIEILKTSSRLEEVKNIEFTCEDKIIGPKFLISEALQCETEYSSFVPPTTTRDYVYDLTNMKKDSLKVHKLDKFEKTKQLVLEMLKTEAKYSWNIWEMRKNALGMAKFVCCRTASTQTDKTHRRLSERLQTHFPRNKIVQTKKDNYSNTPKPSTFIFGLRNRKLNNQFVVDLTLPVDK